MSDLQKGLPLDVIRRVAEETNSYVLVRSWLFKLTGKWYPKTEITSILQKALPKEAAYQTEIIKWLNRIYPGAFIWKATPGPYNRQGIPDICAIIHGRFYGFEVKRPVLGEATKIQKTTMRQIRSAGGIAAVVSTPAEVQKVIRESEKGEQQ